MVGRKVFVKFSGGVFAGRTLANMDSRGDGIPGRFLLGGQVGLNALAGTLYPTFIRSTGAGWALGVGRVGSILGPAIGGVLIALKLPTPMLFLCAAIPAACCAVTVYLLRRIVRTDASTGQPEGDKIRASSAVAGVKVN